MHSTSRFSNGSALLSFGALFTADTAPLPLHPGAAAAARGLLKETGALCIVFTHPVPSDVELKFSLYGDSRTRIISKGDVHLNWMF